MMIVALTGSIGMGKSTTAAMFAALGVPVWDADAAVHRIYGPGGAAVGPVGEAFAGIVGPEGVDRAALSGRVLGDPDALSRLESIVHPLVGQDRMGFLDKARAAGAPLALVDVPLLFETGGERFVDAVVVVSCDPEIQRRRVLDRPGMTVEKFDAIMSRQTPDAEKRARADFLIDTGAGLDAAREQVAHVHARLLERASGTALEPK